MRKNCANIRLVHAFRRKQRVRVLQVLFREFLVVYIVQITDRFPISAVRAEMLRHRTHCSGYRKRMRKQMRFLHMLCENRSRLIHRKCHLLFLFQSIFQSILYFGMRRGSTTSRHLNSLACSVRSRNKL